MEELRKFLDGRVVVKIGNITEEDADAIVNAANGTLMGGGGVDGAIHRAGGPAILEQCKEIRRTTHPDGLPAGHAIATTAGKMKAKYVIHTVGPVYSPGKEKTELLAACYRNSLALAAKHGLATIAFPSISTGVYGYPREEAALVSSRTIENFLRGESIVREVRLIFFSRADADVFVQNHAFSR